MKALHFFFATLFPLFAIAQPGTLDPEFNEDGKAIYSHTIYPSTYGNHTIVQPDGRILVTGGAEGVDETPVGIVLRYMPDGTPDKSFSQDGRMALVNNEFDTYGRAIALLPDGRIVVLTALDNETSSIVVLYCFHPDGTPDFSFGEQGNVRFDLDSRYLGTYAMTVQADGKIVFAGYIGEDDEEFNTVYMTRYFPDGSIDSLFGVNGLFSALIGDGYTSINSLAVQPDGHIVATGYCAINNAEGLLTIRVTPEGELDATFHQDGIATMMFPTGFSSALGLVIQPDGKIVIGGYVISEVGNSDICVVRYTAHGYPDPDFDEDGILIYSPSVYHDRARGLCLQPDGKIVLGGYVHQSGNVAGAGNAALIRLLPNGELDETFDDDGLAEYPLSSTSENIAEVVMQPDGKILATGSFEQNEKDYLVVLRVISGFTVALEDDYRSGNSVSLFPNPAATEINIAFELQAQDNIQINLVDRTGRVLDVLLPQTMRPAGRHEERFQLPLTVDMGIYLVEIIGKDTGRIASPLVIGR
jgi:uncharacterized delta-60 repeat protein